MKVLKVGGVILGAFIITTLGISAADTFSGNSGSLLSQLSGTDAAAACPEGMTEVVVGQTFSCVDTYEASISNKCPVAKPETMQDTQANINTLECIPQSIKHGLPWTYVTRAQAQTLCARVGKRLPSSDEWFTFAVGTPDSKGVCNTTSVSAAPSGSYETCTSGAKVYDAIGNVWEWTNDDVFDGTFNGRNMPGEGFVRQVDNAGVATVTGTESSEAFGADYFWHHATGAYGMIRGGFYGSREDAGLYAVHTKTAPTEAAIAIGFRCVR